MSNPLFNLENIIDLEKWHRLQDSLARVTKMAIITVNYKGVPVTRHSSCQAFCRGVRADDMLSPYCQKCDARGGLEAVRLNAPYIYKCHFNIIDIAIPIIIDNQYIGAVMAGQIKLSDSSEQLEQVVTRPPSREMENKFHSLAQDYESLPVLSAAEVSATADMLFQLCHYIVEEAITKNAAIQRLTPAQPRQTPDSRVNQAAQSGRTAPQQTEESSPELLTPSVEYLLQGVSLTPVRPSNALLQPAFDHFYRNPDRTITLNEMARQCHISPTYFSRIFTRETGENFSVFAPRMKVEWARQLLLETDMPIHEISDALGFCDAGYFIKTFKRFERMTPGVYRNSCRNQHQEMNHGMEVEV